MRKEKRPVSKHKPYKESAAPLVACYCTVLSEWVEVGWGRARDRNIVRSMSFKVLCENALKEKIRQYQKWKNELVQRQMVLSLWNNRWVRAEVMVPWPVCLECSFKSYIFSHHDRPGLCGFVLIWCLLSLSATKMISVPRSTKEKAAIWKTDLRRHKKE